MSHVAKQEMELHTLKCMTELLPFVQDMLLCLILMSNHLLLHGSESWYFRCRFFSVEGASVKYFQIKKEHVQINRPVNSNYLIFQVHFFYGITFVKARSNARPKFHFQKRMGLQELPNVLLTPAAAAPMCIDTSDMSPWQTATQRKDTQTTLN